MTFLGDDEKVNTRSTEDLEEALNTLDASKKEMEDYFENLLQETHEDDVANVNADIETVSQRISSSFETQGFGNWYTYFVN